MIYQEIQAGRLRARKLGRRTLILAADLSAWLANLPLVKP
jgi:excisionase family DNA binding protein